MGRGGRRILPFLRGFGAGLAGATLDWAGPSYCRACDAPLLHAANGAIFCEGCATPADPRTPRCRRCALPLAAAAPGGEALCPNCRAAPPLFDAALSGGIYEGPHRQAVLRYKYSADHGALPYLCGRILAALRDDPLDGILARSGALVPVPTDRWRRFRRGWDPVLELARDLARLLDLPVLEALRKRGRTTPQSRLTLVERRRNLRGAFVVPVPASLPRAVVLLDDVLTTGTTASRCTGALKRHGVRAVGVLTAARAVPGEEA